LGGNKNATGTSDLFFREAVSQYIVTALYFWARNSPFYRSPAALRGAAHKEANKRPISVERELEPTAFGCRDYSRIDGLPALPALRRTEARASPPLSNRSRVLHL